MAEEVVVKLRAFEQGMKARVKKALSVEMTAFAGHIRREHLTGGTTSTKLAVRTGRLRASVRPAPVRFTPTTVETGITVGTVYGAMHFGRRGTFTTIRPVNKKWLTIPLDAVKTKAGVARGSALSGMWGETFFRRDVDAGGIERLILYGKRVTQRGSRAGTTRGKIVPLFLLVKKVKIPARVDPRDLTKWIKPRLVESFRRAVGEVVEG